MSIDREKVLRRLADREWLLGNAMRPIPRLTPEDCMVAGMQARRVSEPYYTTGNAGASRSAAIRQPQSNGGGGAASQASASARVYRGLIARPVPR